jgi:hypothetical protein
VDHRRAGRFAGGRVKKVWFAFGHVSEIGVVEDFWLMLVLQIQVKVKIKVVKRRCGRSVW